MDEILDYLVKVPAWYLATSADGQPHVRPFSFAAQEGGCLWLVTARHKDVWQELQDNPRLEACSWRPGHGWLVFEGRACEGDVSETLRREGWEHLESLGESYEGPDDPELVFFRVDALKARVDDIDGSRRDIVL